VRVPRGRAPWRVDVAGGGVTPGRWSVTSLLTVPNLFSLVRLPLAAAFLLMPGTATRVVIIVAAGISDYLDGWWARTRGPRSRIGALLDPITDKIFVVTALTAFAVEGTLSLAGLLVLLARDIFVTIGFIGILVARSRFRLEARFPGKVVTTLQIAAVLILTLAPAAALPLVAIIAAASVWAIADYAAAGVRALRAPARHG
jgi:CDP-diacylglycerol--glycerol-3-phosphate 3-phosphatidyltransferase